MKRAQEEHKVFKTIASISILLLAVNLLIIVLESTTNAILHDSLYQTHQLNGFTVKTPTHLGVILPLIYIIPRALLTVIACNIYKTKS
jgi:hypothetical protein